MAKHSRLDIGSILLPSVYDELAILIITLIGLIFAGTYAYSSRYDLYRVAVQPKILDPISFVLLRYRLPDFANHATTFLVLAAIGLLLYLGFYLVMNNLVLIRNEATYGTYKHPGTHWHHWGKFFSVEVAKLMLALLLVIGTFLLIHPVISGLVQDLVRLFADKPAPVLPAARDTIFVLLGLNGLLIVFKTMRHLNVN